MINYRERYYELYQFLAGHFNQDWKYVYDWKEEPPNFEAVVSFFKSINPPARVGKVTSELEQLLDLSLTERELGNVLLEDLTCFYYAPSRGKTHRQWLEAMLRILKNPSKAESRLSFIS